MRKNFKILLFCLMLAVTIFAGIIPAKVNAEHTHSFSGGRCACGTYRFEAEDTDYNSTIKSTDASGAGEIVEETELASGGKLVGNWGKAGNKIVWVVNFNRATTATLTLHFAPCSPAANFSEVIKFTANDEIVELVNDSIPALVGTSWYDFKPYETKPVNFPAGNVKIVLEMKVSEYFSNVDCIDVNVSDSVTLKLAEDSTEPVISSITITSDKCVVGKPVEYEYSATDNVTPNDKLVITEKVYLNYKRTDEEEVKGSAGQFTPTKAGRYTIVITATDEAGNKQTATRAVNVENEEDNPGGGTSSSTSGGGQSQSGGANGGNDGKKKGFFEAIGNWEPVSGWPLKVFAWNIIWIPFLIVAGVAGIAYFLYVWVFGRFKMTDDEKKYVDENSESIKKMDRKARKQELKEKSAPVKRMVGWNNLGRKLSIIIVSVVLVISMIATPVLKTTMPYIKEALFPTNTLKPDSEAAKLAIGAAKENVVEIESEGIVLLKNDEEDGKKVLPLDSKSDKDKKINIFGSTAFGMLYGGGGSGVFVTNATSYGNELYHTRLEDALEAEGFEYNRNIYNLVANYYQSGTYKITETSYTIQCQNNVFGANTLDDKGNILIEQTRFPYDNEPEVAAYQKTYNGLDGKTLLEEAKEYSDIAVYAVARAGSEDGDLKKTDTQLTSREVAMINFLKENFKRVIVLINSSNTMELGLLDDEGVDAILWVGHPGLTGNKAVAGVISGRINPSGKLVDTWCYNGDDNPASVMFGHEGARNYSNKSTPFQVYYEGIYLGYRYYVTRALTDPTYKYDEHVQWSFGYGLSYTTFEKHITECVINPEEDKVSVQVAVTNTGDVAGKEVVELYFNAPYTGLVEKPYYELAGFQKTDVIKPGDTFYARVEFAFSDMASWYGDYDGGKGAYLLEAGEYKISLRDNVWDIAKDENTSDTFVNEHAYTLTAQKAIQKDLLTGNTVETRFADVEYGPNDEKVVYLSRSDWQGTYPTASNVNRVASNSVKNSSAVKSYSKDNQISDTDTRDYNQGVKNGLKLADFKGVGINGSIEKDGKKYTYDDLIDQMSVDDMCTLVDSRFMGTVEIKSVGKPEMGDDDGPASVSIYGVGYPSEVVVASTWNPDMGYLLGYSLGKEGASMGMSGWYAPGLNIHRAAPGGRNFEYYSEDPLISGRMGAATVKGAAKFGVYTYIKHFALNDQETNRRTVQVWANEQSMREIYLRAFEIVVKEGGTIGIMSSFNFVGTTWAGGSHALMTEVLRDEWGFEGVAVTDWTNPGTMPVNAGIRAGNDLWLGKNSAYSAKSAYNETPDDVHYLLRVACKRILYAAANSNAVWNLDDYKAVGIDNPPKTNHEALK